MMTSEQKVKAVYPEAVVEKARSKWAYNSTFFVYDKPGGNVIGKSDQERRAWAAAFRSTWLGGDVEYC